MSDLTVKFYIIIFVWCMVGGLLIYELFFDNDGVPINIALIGFVLFGIIWTRQYIKELKKWEKEKNEL